MCVVADRSARPGAGPMRSAQWDDRHMPVADRRVALVTRSSRGLGAVIARRLARDGPAVAIIGRRGDRQALEVADSIGDGGVAEVFGADVTDEQQVAELIAAITARRSPLGPCGQSSSATSQRHACDLDVHVQQKLGQSAQCVSPIRRADGAEGTFYGYRNEKPMRLLGAPCRKRRR
jgi:hypothetical protein